MRYILSDTSLVVIFYPFASFRRRLQLLAAVLVRHRRAVRGAGGQSVRVVDPGRPLPVPVAAVSARRTAASAAARQPVGPAARRGRGVRLGVRGGALESGYK